MPGQGLRLGTSEKNLDILLAIFVRTHDASYAKAELGAALSFRAKDTVPLAFAVAKKKDTISKKLGDDGDDGPDEDDGELTWKPSRQLDLTQPPISDVDEIFKSIVLKAQELGLKPTDTLGKGVDLRILTMCSGTEAPIIAMNMIIKAQHFFGLDALNYRHLGSAEIEPEKQAFIERNFESAVIYRDVTEFTTHSKAPDEEHLLPYTAYGAQQRPPKGVHMLIAGSSCVDFSNLNPSKPESTSESAATFAGVRDYAKVYRPNLILMENVESATWSDFAEEYEKIGYRCKVIHANSINYYVPQTRRRTYCLAIDVQRAELVKFDYEGALHEWANLMAQFQRRASSPYSDFLLSETDQRFLHEKQRTYGETQPRNQGNWTLCRKRHTNTRNSEQLGDATPYTGMKENRVVVMDDSAWQGWVIGQAQRVQDALDINLLRHVAQRGYDMRYKHRNFNHSQNVDRESDSREWGVVGCLTPSGGLFETLRGGPITGIEALHLQGMPIGDLNLNKETSRFLQDLAGNAMTVPVIGASIISALIAGLKFQKAGQESIFEPHPESNASEALGSTDHRNRVLELKSEEQLTQGADDAALKSAFEELSLDNEVSLQEITHSARESQPYCHCEGLDQHVSTNLRFCRHCFYTCCSSCNRKDHDGLFEFSPDSMDRTLARDFVQAWTERLPPVLEFDLSEVDMASLRQHCSEQGMQLSDYMSAAFQGTFRFQGIRFDRSWRIIYVSDNARLELDLAPRRSPLSEYSQIGVDLMNSMKLEPTWLLFAKPKPDEPAGSSIRPRLKYPVAKMRPTETVFYGPWQFRVAPQQGADTNLTINGTGNIIPAWESTLGLDMEKFDTKQVFTELQIGFAQGMTQGSGSPLECILGNYELHQKCPAASGSLYTMQSAEVGTVFLYLDPDPFGESFRDHMVFSTQPPQQGIHDDRSVLAKLDPEWRPTLVNEPWTEIKCALFNVWKPIDAVKLVIPEKETIVKKWHQPKCPADQDATCTESSSIFVMKIPLDPRNQEKWPQGHAVLIDLEDKPEALKDFTWMMKYVAEIPRRHSALEPIASSTARKCSTCSPAPPSLEWFFVKNGVMKASEVKEEATRFEKQLKQRPKPALAILHCHGQSGLLDVQLNITTMAHRATSLHVGHIGKLLDLLWHIERYNHLATPPKFVNIKISSNISGEVIATLRLGNRLLWKSQREVLAWMQQCEDSPQLWNELAQVECRLPSLQCRVEVKSFLEREIRGGVVADDVGAGKTTTSLALIGLDYETLGRGEAFTEECPSGLIKTDATLIFMPKNIMQQWVSEIEQCLPSWNCQLPGEKAASVEQPYYIVLKNSKQLAQCSVERLKGAHLVLVPLTIFEEEHYWDRLKMLVCAPNTPTNPGRAFQEWLSQALEGLKSMTPELVDNESQVWKNWEALGADKSSYERFHLQELTKTRQGNKSGNDMDADARKQATDAANVVKEFEDDRRKFKKEGKIPTLLHEFQFRRIIIDEFAYMKGKTLLAILRLAALSMWLLSGTPPIHNFDGLNTMAKLLGTRISPYNENDGKFGFGSDGAKMARDKTEAQSFRSFKTVQSAAYKQALYDHAAAFAELFMRKNKPAVHVAEQITHERKFKLTPCEHLALFDVEGVLDSDDIKFNQQMTAKKWEELGSSLYDTKLRAAVRELSGPEAARVCAPAILHKIIEIVPKGAQAYEKDVLKALIDDHEKAMLTHTGELFEGLRDLWYGAKHHKPAEDFIKFTQNIKGGVEVTEGMHAILDHLLWQAKAASTNTPPGVRLSAYTSEEKKIAETLGIKPEELQYDFDKLTKGVKEKEMLIRMLRVHNMVKSLSKGFGRLRLLKAVLALIQNGQLEDCSRCKRPLDTAEKAEISMACGHIVACIHCREELRPLEDPNCCELFLDEYVSPVAPFLVTQDARAEKLADKVKGSMMQKAASILEAAPESESAVVFVQFARIKSAFVEACKAMDIVCLDGFSYTEREVKKFKAAATEGRAVLILKVDSEDAAGWNLQEANHVLFLGDMVELGEEDKAAAIEQAAGRCRRPGQEKPQVHVYHLAAF
ncbi:hypothetical protein EDD36DRAFT_409129 [Exophiala viscosa]|uniref:Helicase ATP-binding domain-containing protein n=1 Tax=Exophiala viscosa TaxID=2486360 RepID=A0AAN6IBD7_9EURO|nr:hypothetical protein EDD36DRAFT_409129 [Exophiala viscosa]